MIQIARVEVDNPLAADSEGVFNRVAAQFHLHQRGRRHERGKRNHPPKKRAAHFRRVILRHVEQVVCAFIIEIAPDGGDFPLCGVKRVRSVEQNRHVIFHRKRRVTLRHNFPPEIQFFTETMANAFLIIVG